MMEILRQARIENDEARMRAADARAIDELLPRLAVTHRDVGEDVLDIEDGAGALGVLPRRAEMDREASLSENLLDGIEGGPKVVNHQGPDVAHDSPTSHQAHQDTRGFMSTP